MENQLRMAVDRLTRIIDYRADIGDADDLADAITERLQAWVQLDYTEADAETPTTVSPQGPVAIVIRGVAPPADFCGSSWAPIPWPHLLDVEHTVEVCERTRRTETGSYVWVLKMSVQTDPGKWVLTYE